MYIFKNAFRNITRSKGKNILIGVIITVITAATCIALAIHSAGNNLVKTYMNKNPLEVSFNLNMQNLRGADDSTKTSFQSLEIEDIKNYADSSYIKDYYYTLESSVNGSNIEAVNDNARPTDDENQPDSENQPPENNNKHMMESFGDFRITAYSNFAYLDDFTSGTKKIIDGEMVTGSSSENEVVISESLADANELKVGDSITLVLPNDEEQTFSFKIIGIYEEKSDTTYQNFMGINALNSSNQIYANLDSVQKILDASGENSNETKLVKNNGLTAKFYLNHNDDLDSFEKEVKEKGLSDYYQVTTNEDEILQTLKPIQNISSFSMNFLIVILVIGITILTIINFINIRDRKYEIGILRAIGMSKLKVSLQLVLETFIISIFSLVIGTGIGVLLSQPITNKMLESEINSYQEEIENNQNNFGREGFDRPSQDIKGNNSMVKGSKNQNISYVDSLEVKIDIATILKLFAISILLTSTSAFTASIAINKYNPNKILQNRN